MKEKIAPKFERIMVIDDNEIDLLIVKRIIEMNNFAKQVLEYSSPEEALKYLQDNMTNLSMLPEVVFIDIYMPLMTGFEFIGAYDKLSPALKDHCKVYIISSTNNTRDISRARNDNNVVDFQEKPITKEFLEKIRSTSKN